MDLLGQGVTKPHVMQPSIGGACLRDDGDAAVVAQTIRLTRTRPVALSLGFGHRGHVGPGVVGAGQAKPAAARGLDRHPTEFLGGRPSKAFACGGRPGCPAGSQGILPGLGGHDVDLGFAGKAVGVAGRRAPGADVERMGGGRPGRSAAPSPPHHRAMVGNVVELGRAPPPANSTSYPRRRFFRLRQPRLILTKAAGRKVVQKNSSRASRPPGRAPRGLHQTAAGRPGGCGFAAEAAADERHDHMDVRRRIFRVWAISSFSRKGAWVEAHTVALPPSARPGPRELHGAWAI